MPASRSRTERWYDCLCQIAERDGALEISIASSDEAAADLIWRVRVLSLGENHIIVEQPSAAGQYIDIATGVELIAAMSIGQNRWMFRTRTLTPPKAMPGRQSRVLCLQMPDQVERCQRRNFYRMSTAELSLPRVECWPLINPTSVVAAEVANRAWIMDLINGMSPDRLEDESLILPEVGPKFQANLMNLGGGGVGLMINRTEASAAERARLFWLRIDLTPSIPAPIAMTARLAHTHIDSSQNLYAGFAFEWSFNAGHRDFVVDQITRYVGDLQRRQSAKAA